MSSKVVTTPALKIPLDWFLTSQWLKCPRLYNYRSLGIRTGKTQSPAIQFGLAYHSNWEAFWAVDCEYDQNSGLDKDLPTPYSVAVLDALWQDSLTEVGNFFEASSFIGFKTKPELLLAPKTELQWRVKADCVVTLSSGEVWILEYKTSRYALSPAALDVFCTSDGQVSGQLYSGKQLYGENFKGVLLVHAKVAATAKARKVTLVPITFNQQRNNRWIELVLDVRHELANISTTTGPRMNTINCMSFNRLCSFYGSCHGDESLPAPSDQWVPGEGWTSEKETKK